MIPVKQLWSQITRRMSENKNWQFIFKTKRMAGEMWKKLCWTEISLFYFWFAWRLVAFYRISNLNCSEHLSGPFWFYFVLSYSICYYQQQGRIQRVSSVSADTVRFFRYSTWLYRCIYVYNVWHLCYIVLNIRILHQYDIKLSFSWVIVNEISLQTIICRK